MDIYAKAFNVFRGINARCYNVNAKSFKDYGGRGIYVGEDWRTNSIKFVEWYAENYFDGAQVDRIDNNGPYTESNCRMATALQNHQNRRTTKKIVAWGEKKTIAQWVLDERSGSGVNYDVILYRLKTISPEEAISTPVSEIRGQQYYTPKYELDGENKTLLEWSEDPRCVVSYKTLNNRMLAKSGKWSLLPAMTIEAREMDHSKSYKLDGIEKSLLEWSRDSRCVVGYTSLYSRMSRGWQLLPAMTKPARAIKQKS